MPDFTVSIDGLAGLGQDLDNSKENIDWATERLAGLTSQQLGPDVLVSACDDFRDSWEDGLDELGEAIDEIREGIDEAKNAYQELEETVAEQLNTMAEKLEVPTTDGESAQ